MTLSVLIALALAAFAISAIATGGVLRMLHRRQVLDRPNERSSHSVPTPRGGGIAVIGTILALAGLLLAAQGNIASPAAVPLLAALALAVLSWRDDLAGLPVAIRFGAHILAVVVGLAVLSPDALVLQGLAPLWLDRLLTGLAWVWFVNLYNFMDGIDGIAATETIAVGGGGAVVGSLVGAGMAAAMGSLAAGAAAGFLLWNWRPARIFLGDVGSVPLGYLLGALLIALALAGAWPAALLLALYYWADATLTLIRRALRGEAVWRSHASHLYQHAARRTGDHAVVVRAVAATNIALVAAAVLATLAPGSALPALLFGVLASALLLWYLGRR